MEANRPRKSDESEFQDANARKVSVILATYNRLDLLRRLLGFLSEQTLPPNQFEVIVVDDGSVVPVPLHIDVEKYPFSLTIVRQENAGPAAARHRGILQAKGEFLVLVDDDMELPPSFLEAHLRHHAGVQPTAVIGRYVSDPAISKKPIFERYHGLKWDRTTQLVREGKLRIDGTFLATGNTSMRRDDYLRVGGFDLSLLRAEDMALGLDLEEAGVNLVYSDSAGSVHLSDHTSAAKWMARAYLHGRLEPHIAEKHPTMAHADPWRFAFALPLVGRMFCLPSILAPKLGSVLARATYKAAEVADKVGLERPALRATGLVFGMEYFRGLREEAGSARKVLADCVSFLRKASCAPQPLPGVPTWFARAVMAVSKAK
jgi:glycosyltransferase involved in cell wall biosynthesis